MPRAYVLINVETGTEENVLRELKNLGVVEEAYISYGVYDLFVKINGGTMEDLRNAVTQKIRTLNQVRSTLTLIVTE